MNTENNEAPQSADDQAPQGADTGAYEGAHTDSEAPEGATPTDRRPLGYWLRTIDGLISRAFDEAFTAEGASRRDWMLLNALSRSIDVPGLAEKLARRGKRLGELADRGWVAETDGRWALTDEGRKAQARLAGIVQKLRERVAGAVAPEDFASLTSSLEAIARELGWDENQRMPRGRGFGGRGFGSGGGRGFGQAPWAFGPGPWAFGRGFRGFGPGFDPRRGFGNWSESDRHGHPGHEGHPGHPGHHGRHGGKGERRSERAFERGFAAGFEAAQRAERSTSDASDSAA